MPKKEQDVGFHGALWLKIAFRAQGVFFELRLKSHLFFFLIKHTATVLHAVFVSIQFETSRFSLLSIVGKKKYLKNKNKEAGLSLCILSF